MKISVVTPTIRKEMLDIVHRCLSRQTCMDFEWLIVGPKELNYSWDKFIEEPPKREGDFYNLNKAWNAAFKQAKGELIVSIVDGLWFPPDTLEKLWYHYENNPMSCIGGVGHQYDQMENGKPEHRVWFDPRMKEDLQFYEVPPNDFELCVASLPLKGIKDVGGMDEKWDQYAALSEKELCYRMSTIGYMFNLDQSIEYRAISHPRLHGQEEWDKHYFAGCDYFRECLKEIDEGKRTKLDYLS